MEQKGSILLKRKNISLYVVQFELGKSWIRKNYFHYHN
jgi:hypothetical protein